MYHSTHVTRRLALNPLRCQVVGEANREEHPPVRHAGGSEQSGSSDGSERGEEGLGGQQALGEGLPGKRKKHTWAKTQNMNWINHC